MLICCTTDFFTKFNIKMTHSPLPKPSTQAQAAHTALCNLIADTITQHGGLIPFSHFMQLALYAPELGYYTGGMNKIGADGDFITAPVLTPLFADTLAKQFAQILPQTQGNIYEFGAGTGVLAADLLQSLGEDIQHYYIMEVSPDLAERQRLHITKQVPQYTHKVIHITTLPDHLDGIIFGNEVLDAMPIELILRTEKHQFQQIFVANNEQSGFEYRYQNLDTKNNLYDLAASYFPTNIPYQSELHPAQHAFVRTLAERMHRGGMIWLDYGFDAAQYYHPQRNNGTLIGHHRHHTVHDPFYRIGLTDLTAHVNFTDIAQAGFDSGLDLIGYTTQSTFLLNSGILDALTQRYPNNSSHAYIRAAHAIHILTAPHEMGELFKVIAFGKNVDINWMGFENGDLCHKL